MGAGRNLGEFDITGDVKITKIRLDTRPSVTWGSRLFAWKARCPFAGSRIAAPGEIVAFAWIASWMPLLIEAPTCTDSIRSEYLNSYPVKNF
jgi:hypothetical protein